LKKVISSVLILCSIGIFVAIIPKKIKLKQNVTGLLKRAADASTIELAEKEVSKVINYLETNNITSGYTSVFWETPDEDIGFWYKNLKASQSELRTLKSESALERTNVLIKLRETLVDEGERTKVTVPRGLALFPQNKTWAFLITFALIGGFIGIMIPIIEHDKKMKRNAKKSNNN